MRPITPTRAPTKQAKMPVRPAQLAMLMFSYPERSSEKVELSEGLNNASRW